MKTDNVPALVMLTAGFIDCVIAIVRGQSLLPFTKQLLIVLLIFYILGSIIKVILDRNFNDMDERKDDDPGEEVKSTDANEADVSEEEQQKVEEAGDIQE